MKNKISLIKRLGISAVAGIASVLSAADANAQTSQPSSQPVAQVTPAQDCPQYLTAKTRVENTNRTDARGNESNFLTSTLELTPLSGPLASPESARFGPLFRMYDNQNVVNGKNLHSQQVAVSTPFLRFNENPTDGWYSQFFAATGDCNEGFGNQTKVKIGGLTVTGNAEKRSLPTEASRLGIGADYDWKIGDSILTTGAGIDSVETATGRTNYFSGKAVLDTKVLPLEGRDRFGLSARLADADGKHSSNILASQSHHGAKAPVGWRLFERLDSCPEDDFTSFTASGIVAQNPTFGMCPPYEWNGSFKWLDGDRTGGGMFDVPVVQNALGAERCALNYRSKEGIVSAYTWNTTKSGNSRSSSIEGDLGYTFRETCIGGVKIKPGFYVFDKATNGSGRPSTNTVGASGIVDFNLGKGWFMTGEVTGSKCDSGASDIFLGLSLGKSW